MVVYVLISIINLIYTKKVFVFVWYDKTWNLNYIYN